MDWIQVLTIVGSTIGCCWFFRNDSKEQMNEIKNKFFVPLLGLIVYDTNRPGIPVATTAADWAIISLSQAQWVFGLKSAYTKYEFIQRQT